MNWVFYLGLILLVLGALALIGFKILPVKKNWNFVFVALGLLIITGLGATLWGGISSLAIQDDQNTNEAPNTNAYSYSVLASSNIATQLIDANNKVITAPVNLTSPTTFNANFTIGVTDAYADMRGVKVDCNTNQFLQQNVSVSDSTQYTIVTKDTAGLPQIRIADSAGVYSIRSRTFLLGGESSTGQTVTVNVYGTIDSTAIQKVNVYNTIPIACQVAGQSWVIGIQRITP